MGESSDGGSSPVKTNALFDEFHTHAFLGQSQHEGPLMVQVPGEPIRAVDHYSVTVVGEAQEFGKLRSDGIPAGSLVAADRPDEGRTGRQRSNVQRQCTRQSA